MLVLQPTTGVLQGYDHVAKLWQVKLSTDLRAWHAPDTVAATLMAVLASGEVALAGTGGRVFVFDPARPQDARIVRVGQDEHIHGLHATELGLVVVCFSGRVFLLR